MTLEAFDRKARELGTDVGKQMWKMLLSGIDEAVKETGNELNIKKGELNQDDVLRMLDMVEHNFDEQGNSTHQFVFGSELAEEFRKRMSEWAGDAEF